MQDSKLWLIFSSSSGLTHLQGLNVFMPRVLFHGWLIWQNRFISVAREGSELQELALTWNMAGVKCPVCADMVVLQSFGQLKSLKCSSTGYMTSISGMTNLTSLVLTEQKLRLWQPCPMLNLSRLSKSPYFTELWQSSATYSCILWLSNSTKRPSYNALSSKVLKTGISWVYWVKYLPFSSDIYHVNWSSAARPKSCHCLLLKQANLWHLLWCKKNL